MKKFLLTMAVAATTLFATAQTKTYTDNLVVAINGNASEPMQTTINVKNNGNTTYSLSLNEFTLDGIAVGNIVIDDITVTEEGGIKSFATKQNILITAGEDNEKVWIGPMLGEVPVDLKGEMTNGSLFCNIDIDFTEGLGQVIMVQFGKDIKSAKTYTDDLVVAINGNASEPIQTTINVDEKVDGTYSLSLNDFTLDGIAVGNIVLHDITTTTAGEIKNFATKQNILITAGEDNEKVWIGPMLGEVPVDLAGKMTEHKLYCNIDIDMTASLGQTINVTFGSEDLSGIEDIILDKGEVVIYDITGRRVNAITTPGIYIINGKKQIIK